MLFLLPLTGLLQMCAGGVYPSPPTTFVSTSEAHGPLARLALSSGRVPQALQYHSTPHVPGPALVVPTYLAQQRLVEIPTPKVATARLQVRRPAIQKQFYDIEQRTVIRPVGSAVVQLEEPLSKSYLTPFTVTPTPQQVSTKYAQQLVYPVASYPFGPFTPLLQAPAQSYPSPFIQRPVVISQLPQQFLVYPQQTQPQLPAIPPVGVRPPQFPSFPQPPQQTQPQPPTETQRPQKIPILSSQQTPEDSTGNDEFDSSDTVVIDNPDFTRSSNRLNEFSPPEPRSLSLSNANKIQEPPQKIQTAQKNEETIDQDSQERNQQILNEFQNRQLLRMFLTQPMSIQQFQQLLPIQSNKQFQPINLDEAKTLLGPQGLASLEPIHYDSKYTNTKLTSTTETAKEQSAENITEHHKTEISSTTEQSSSNVPVTLLDIEEGSQRIHRQYFNEDSTLVRNLSPQEAQDNQQKFIELLTGQGDVSEIDLSRPGVRLSVVGDSGLVKGRVLSVTPAPTGQVEDERVSTRRVVVSRPIQTLEEVDDHQPFTKVESVTVHDPVLAPTPTTLVYH